MVIEMKIIKRKRNIMLCVMLVFVMLSGCIKNETTTGKNIVTQKQTTGQQETTVEVRIGSLKGPTSMGLVELMNLDKNYSFTMETDASVLLTSMVKGELDIALLPANVAATLYQKTEGNVTVIDVNTLGVLYLLTADESVSSVADLKGKTVYLTGKGTTPDYVLQYLLQENGLSLGDLTLEYKSESAEVAAVLAENPDAIGLLPQPFATSAKTKNQALINMINLNDEWNAVQGDEGGMLVTGVTVVRNEFLEEHKEIVEAFISDHKESADFVNKNTSEAAELVVSYGILDNKEIAEQALPLCSITCLDGAQMQTALSGYLDVLYQFNPESVGGALPKEDFYYVP